MNVSQSLYFFMKSYPREKHTTALSFRGKKISETAFLKKIDSLAFALQKHGVKKGDSVAIALPNVPEAVIALYAVNLVGAVADLIHPKTHYSKIRAAIELTGSKIIFAYAPLWSEQRKAIKDETVVLCGGFSFASRLFGALSFSGFAAESGAPSPVEVGGEDTAVYMHSGGTMGEPKTVMLSNRAVNALVENMFTTIGKGYGKRDAMLAILPIFHGFGLIVSIHATLCKGIKVVLVPSFNARRAATIIKKEKITIIAGIPRMFEKMLNCSNFHGDAIKSVEDIFCGGDYLRPETKKAFEDRLREAGAKARFCQGYGLTEMASVCVLDLENTYDTVGRPFVNTEARILDESGKPAERGRLWLCGTQCMSGYLKDAESTAKALVELDGDGKLWLNTGDVVEKDEDGRLRFADRAKRVIKISGISVFPSVIERTAREVPGVNDACVVEKRVGNKPYTVLFVAASGDCDDVEQKIISHCKGNLSRWFIPRRVTVLPKLPVTPLGKTDVKFLEKLAESVSI